MFDEAPLPRLDADPEVRQLGRSAVLRPAAAEYLRRGRVRNTADAYQRAYGAIRPALHRIEGLARRGRMAGEVNHGEIWTRAVKGPDNRRPALVLTRQEVIGLLHTVMVAPITSTIYGAPGEVGVGIEEGLKHESAVNLDHVQTVEQSRLVGRIGRLGASTRPEVCHALAVATGCRG